MHFVYIILIVCINYIRGSLNVIYAKNTGSLHCAQTLSFSFWNWVCDAGYLLPVCQNCLVTKQKVFSPTETSNQTGLAGKYSSYFEVWWTYFEGNKIHDIAGRDLDGIMFLLAEISAKWCYLMHFVLPLKEDSQENLQI